jgi:hypothetical protein
MKQIIFLIVGILIGLTIVGVVANDTLNQSHNEDKEEKTAEQIEREKYFQSELEREKLLNREYDADNLVKVKLIRVVNTQETGISQEGGGTIYFIYELKVRTENGKPCLLTISDAELKSLEINLNRDIDETIYVPEEWLDK